MQSSFYSGKCFDRTPSLASSLFSVMFFVESAVASVVAVSHFGPLAPAILSVDSWNTSIVLPTSNYVSDMGESCQVPKTTTRQVVKAMIQPLGI